MGYTIRGSVLLKLIILQGTVCQWKFEGGKIVYIVVFKQICGLQPNGQISEYLV